MRSSDEHREDFLLFSYLCSHIAVEGTPDNQIMVDPNQLSLEKRKAKRRLEAKKTRISLHFSKIHLFQPLLVKLIILPGSILNIFS